MQGQRINCPVCGRRLFDASEYMAAITTVSPADKNDSPDYQMKCNFCKHQINVKIKSA